MMLFMETQSNTFIRLKILLLGMKSYRANTPKDALRKALHDKEMGWTPSEKRALQNIITDRENFGIPNGNGRDWKVKRGRIVFHTAETENGYSVGRWL